MAQHPETQSGSESHGARHARARMEGLLASYEARLKTVGALMAQAIEALRHFRGEQDRALGELRDSLAQRESLRRKDFDAMMGAIRSQRRDREHHVSQMVAEFLSQGENTLERLRSILWDGQGLGPGEREALVGKVLAQHQSCERKAGEALRDLHLEQAEVEVGLREFLARGRGPRVRDLKALARAFRTHRSLVGHEVRRTLRQLDSAREEVLARWRALLGPTAEARVSAESRRGEG